MSKQDHQLKFDTCPKCGSDNWSATKTGASCLVAGCDWVYVGSIYQDGDK